MFPSLSKDNHNYVWIGHANFWLNWSMMAKYDGKSKERDDNDL